MQRVNCLPSRPAHRRLKCRQKKIRKAWLFCSSADNEIIQRTRNDSKIYKERKKERKKEEERKKEINGRWNATPEKKKEKWTVGDTRYLKKERERHICIKKKIKEKKRERSKVSFHFNIVEFFAYLVLYCTQNTSIYIFVHIITRKILGE